MIRGYKIKIYPNNEQKQILLKNIGSCRFVYNHFLALKKQTYLETGKNITYNVMSKELTKLRKEIDWLQEAQFQPLQQSLRNLDVAYNRFFRKQAKFPVFKKKNKKNTMKKVNGWNIAGNKIKIMKNAEIRFRGVFPQNREGTLTITKDSAGGWWASTLGEKKCKQTKLKKSALGVDLGLETLATTSDGNKYENIRSLGKILERIKFASKSLSKKKKGSVRREKARMILARLYRKASFIRINHLHHISKKIVSKNHAMIALEDLAVANMMKNRRLSRSIGDAGWGELVRQIKYKQEWKGGSVVQIGRFFPSSKTCSVCNFIVDTLPMSVRKWTCGKCNTKHDRDINASVMIAKQATFLLGAEGGDGSGRVRSTDRVTRPKKRGGSLRTICNLEPAKVS